MLDLLKLLKKDEVYKAIVPSFLGYRYMYRFKDLIRIEKGKAFLLGNEAIARGAIEGGIGVASAYPGTPSSEIVEALTTISKDLGIYVEWSINEKVAFEVAFAAAITGVRSLVAMKHVGLNVAADPLMSSAYTGVNEGFVIVSADDPSMWSSQNEQDNRFYGMHAYIPVFEPYGPGEAKELVKYSLEFSSKIKHPVIFRSTTRISHTRGVVDLGPIPKSVKVKGGFGKELRFALVPAVSRKNKLALLERWRKISEEVEHCPFNFLEGDGKHLIIAPGVAYSHVREAIQFLGVKAKILKLSSVYPIPEAMLLKAVSDVDDVVIIEELDPVTELQVRSILHKKNITIRVAGKDLVEYPYELSIERVVEVLSKFYNVPNPLLQTKAGGTKGIEVPARPPTFCPGCPYRPLFFEIRRYINREKLPYIASGDIGCYALSLNEPYKLQDLIIEMGGSIGLANGLSKVTDDMVFSFIGDSTFFHAGMPALANAIYNRSPQVVVILDNQIVAMTGHQPSPSTVMEGKKAIAIEDVVKGLGVEFIRVVDPFEIDDVRRSISEAVKYVREKKMPAVIIARRRCALVILRDLRRRSIMLEPCYIDQEKCIGCGTCYNWFACPAISKVDGSNKAVIDPSLCVGCGSCVIICPVNAIKLPKGTEPRKLKELWR